MTFLDSNKNFRVGRRKKGRKMKTERGVKVGKTLIFVVLFAAFLSVGCASAVTTYTVCPSGCDYTSIPASYRGSRHRRHH